MPVYITDPDALDKLEAIEGNRWRTNDGGADRFHKMRRALLGFFRMLDQYGMELSEWVDPPFLEDGDGGIEPVLYGDAGYSRYVLRADGELVLLGWSTREERIEQARAQGFSVSGSPNPSRRTRRALAKARRVITGPVGAVGIAGVLFAASIVVLYAARRSGGLTLGPRPNPGPGRTAVIGDSIVAHEAGFVRYLDQNVPGRSFTNFGVVGQGTEAILSNLRNRVINRGFDEVIVEGGANDLSRSNASSYITSRLRTMVQEAKAAGMKVVLLPMAPMAQAARQIPSINATILSQGRSWGADVVVDTYSPLDNGRGGIISQHVNQDGIHPTRSGQQIMGQAILSRAYA